MKNSRNIPVGTVLCLFALLLASCSHEAVLASYNICNGKGLDGKRDIERTAAVLKALDADFIAVQEVDSMTRRSGQTDVLRLLAEATGMHAVYGPAIDYDGGRYGVGILSREKPLSVSRYPLPGREESRMLLAVEYRRCVFACTHLSLTEDDRMASLPILTALSARNTGKPLFVTGDFNASPDEPFIQQLSDEFAILSDPLIPTFPSNHPEITIDYLVCRHARHMPAVLSTTVFPDTITSDHRPILTRLRW